MMLKHRSIILGASCSKVYLLKESNENDDKSGIIKKNAKFKVPQKGAATL